MRESPPRTPRIGVFDSGVGGLSVLRALHAALPGAALHYLADSAHAPYGDRSADEVIERSQRLTSHLLDRGARMIVVACNTATTAAIHALRSRWPEVPFVGVEPGVKPAAASSVSKRIGVLATQRTVSSERLQSLIRDHASDCHVVLRACPGLVDAIEAQDEPLTQRLLQEHCRPLAEAEVDTVVLGCTHYPFIAPQIQSLLGPKVRLVDTAEAVAQRAEQVWSAMGVGGAQAVDLVLQTTGDTLLLTSMAQRWLSPGPPGARIEAQPVVV